MDPCGVPHNFQRDTKSWNCPLFGGASLIFPCLNANFLTILGLAEPSIFPASLQIKVPNF